MRYTVETLYGVRRGVFVLRDTVADKLLYDDAFYGRPEAEQVAARLNRGHVEFTYRGV